MIKIVIDKKTGNFIILNDTDAIQMLAGVATPTRISRASRVDVAAELPYSSILLLLDEKRLELKQRLGTWFSWMFVVLKFFKLRILLKRTILRALKNDLNWWADLSPICKKILGPYPSKAEAVNAEISWIYTNIPLLLAKTRKT